MSSSSFVTSSSGCRSTCDAITVKSTRVKFGLGLGENLQKLALKSSSLKLINNNYSRIDCLIRYNSKEIAKH